ncbi:hypothetical protein [Ralstonia syzygii]|uniref:hypothetical protein n=1 Tax=Ralstonia syzygii TaxID=28097 RepID=UPI001E65A984|nr:hypothetical protein [Ralstonia syzygii]
MKACLGVLACKADRLEVLHGIADAVFVDGVHRFLRHRVAAASAGGVPGSSIGGEGMRISGSVAMKADSIHACPAVQRARHAGRCRVPRVGMPRAR